METGERSDLWWKNAVVSCVDVETDRDGNGDGIGDFAGLTPMGWRHRFGNGTLDLGRDGADVSLGAYGDAWFGARHHR